MKLWILALVGLACASGMRINPDPIQSINQSMTDVGGDWLWSSDPVYDNTYSQVLTQPISLDVVTLSDIRWFTPSPVLTIRQTSDSNSRVDWSGIAYLLPDPSGGGSAGVSSFAGRTGPVVPQASDYAGFYLGSIHDSMTVERARVPDSARASGLSDSAKALVRYARTTALHDTANILRTYTTDRIHDSLNDLAAIARSGSAADLISGYLPDARLPNLVAYSTTGDASHVAQVTTDTKGRIIGIGNVAITPAAIGAVSTAGGTYSNVYTFGPLHTSALQITSLGSGFVKSDASGNLSYNNLTSGDVTGALGFTPQAAGSYQPLENQRLSTTNSPTFSTVTASSNGSGQNFLVGDDLWIGDVNLSCTSQLSGVQDATQAFLRFGSSGPTLGYNGSLFSLTSKFQLASGGIPNLQYGLLVGRSADIGASNVAALQIGLATGYTPGALEIDTAGRAIFGVDRNGNIAQSGMTGGGIVRAAASTGALSASALAVSDLPASIQTVQSIPAGRVAIGNGTSGLTSSASLTWASNLFGAGYPYQAQMGTSGAPWVWFGKGGGNTGNPNTSVGFGTNGTDAVVVAGTTTFYDASGAPWASIGASSNNFTAPTGLAATTISGTFKPRSIVVTSSTYTLPTVAVGEQILLIFDASAVTVSTGGSQGVDYRNASGAYEYAYSGASTVIAASAFGTATTRISAATLIGVNSTRARLVF
jgi:hypothetical protein